MIDDWGILKGKIKSWVLHNGKPKQGHVSRQVEKSTILGYSAGHCHRSGLAHSPSLPGVNSDIHWRLLYIFWACANPFYHDCCVPHLSRSHPGSGGLGLQHSVSDSRAQALIHLTGALHPPLGAPFPQAQFADAHLSHDMNCASRAGTVLSASHLCISADEKHSGSAQ